MSIFKVLFYTIFGLLALTSKADADCGVCSQLSYAACINETAFKICFDGLTASSQIVTCPENTVCTDEAGVCHPKETSTVACAPLECNSCSGPFACVSETEFAFCDSNGQPGVVSSCVKGQYCNIQHFTSSQEICMLSCLGEPTCSNTEVVTVPPPVPDFKETCVSTQTKGYYKNIHDNTCKTYVYCETLNGVMNAILYTCQTGYFNQATQTCVTTKPSGCT